MNTGTFFGRIIANYFADTSGRYNLIIPAAFSSATLVLAILGIGNAAGAIVVALLYGVTNGARSSSIFCQRRSLLILGCWECRFIIDTSCALRYLRRH